MMAMYVLSKEVCSNPSRPFLNNHTIMHARSEFEDWADPQQNRLMLRLYPRWPDFAHPMNSSDEPVAD